MTTCGTVDGTASSSVDTSAGCDCSSAVCTTDLSVTFDTTPPTVTINQAAGQGDPTSAAPITFTAVFSEPVSGFTGSGVTISGTARSEERRVGREGRCSWSAAV